MVRCKHARAEVLQAGAQEHFILPGNCSLKPTLVKEMSRNTTHLLIPMKHHRLLNAQRTTLNDGHFCGQGCHTNHLHSWTFDRL